MVKIYTQPPPLQSFKAHLARIHAWRDKVDRTILDIQEGRLSFSTGTPVVLSRLDNPRGHFFIVDGHHRILEALIRGDTLIRATIDLNVPRIERTGGAYAYWLSNMVNVSDASRPFQRDRKAPRP